MNLNDRFNFKKSERKPKDAVSLSEQAKGNTKIKSATPLWARIMVIAVLVLFMMVILAVTFAIGYFKYLEASFDVNEAIASGDIPVLGKTSMDTRSAIYVQDKNGEWVRHRDLSGGNSLWMDLDDIPKYMQDAVVAIEDERFWEHEGVDWKRTTGAMINLVLNRAFDLGDQPKTQRDLGRLCHGVQSVHQRPDSGRLPQQRAADRRSGGRGHWCPLLF